MRPKTTRAFRTISEAGEELGLQPHVLRFWESKFAEIKPIKRGGGRRFYRPEDIELLRGIKILLHDEKHPIKDVQKLIRIKGPERVIELGRTVEPAAIPKKVEDTVLVPERLQSSGDDVPDETPEKAASEEAPSVEKQQDDPATEPVDDLVYETEVELDVPTPFEEDEEDYVDIEKLEDALNSLNVLRARWKTFQSS